MPERLKHAAHMPVLASKATVSSLASPQTQQSTAGIFVRPKKQMEDGWLLGTKRTVDQAHGAWLLLASTEWTSTEFGGLLCSVPFFLRDLMASFKGLADVHEQAKKDMPRTRVYVNGTRTSSYRAFVRATIGSAHMDRLLAVSTQASLGMLMRRLVREHAEEGTMLSDFSVPDNPARVELVEHSPDRWSVTVCKVWRKLRFRDDGEVDVARTLPYKLYFDINGPIDWCFYQLLTNA